MSWYEKEQTTLLDSATIEGLQFLNGSEIARNFRQPRLDSKKYPLILFPSGISRQVVFRDADPPVVLVHIMQDFLAPYSADGDRLGELLKQSSDAAGYVLSQPSSSVLRVKNRYSPRWYDLSYDSETGVLSNIQAYPTSSMELLPGECRAALPPLYFNENVGLEAIAPVKFFTPDANWTWYATEYDGIDVFFGLVSGYDVELGYFSLSELESVSGGMHLPIERDLHYTPRTLNELIKLHNR